MLIEVGSNQTKPDSSGYAICRAGLQRLRNGIWADSGTALSLKLIIRFQKPNYVRGRDDTFFERCHLW